jgi:hypothetical protein
MAVTQNALNTPVVLSENLKIIRIELGSDWNRFIYELAPLLDYLVGGANDNILEKTVNETWQLCCRYPFVKGLIFGYGLGYSTERSPRRWRKLEAADFGDETFVREIINRFQSLSDNLKNFTKQEESVPNTEKQGRQPIRYRGNS